MPSSSKKYKIMIVENDIPYNNYIKQLISTKDEYEIIQTYTGLETIDEITNNDDISLILLDYYLTDMDALILYEKLLYKNINIPPFIILSGFEDIHIAVNMMKRGAKDYLLKDDSLPKLLPQVMHNVFETVKKEKLLEKTKSALLESEKKFETFTESTPVMLMIHQNAKWIYANSASSKLTGYSIDELKSMHYWELFHKDYRKVSIEITEQVLNGKTKDNDSDVKISTKNNTTKWIHINKELIEYNGEKAVLLSGMNITQRKQMEAKLIHSEKMEVIGQLAGGVAHDFNNQLGGILGYAEMLEIAIQDKKLKHYANCIIKAAKRSADLTKQLLAFARKGEYKSITVNVHDIIKEVTDLLARSIDKRITIKNSLNAFAPFVTGDPSLLQSAILNLALNARDAINSNTGKIIFATENVILKKSYPTLKEYEMSPGNYVMILISDDGKGMSKETKKRIFEPFFTTKKTQGTGMGMAAVYGTVKKMNGYIDVTSNEGEGTNIKIHLPASEEFAIKDDKLNKNIVDLPISLKILIIDDEDMILEMITRMLESLGHNSVICKSGLKGIETFKKDPNYFDLIILDIMMPTIGGKDVFYKLKKINKDIKILLFSGFGLEGTVSEILDAGADAFLQKPFEVNDLAAKIAGIFSD